MQAPHGICVRHALSHSHPVLLRDGGAGPCRQTRIPCGLRLRRSVRTVMMPFRCMMPLLWLLATCAMSLTMAARVRKSWSDYSSQEKSRFLGAVKSAMESGAHYRFAAMHSDNPSNDYAHRNCGFLLWHRRFLLAYENMLRAQGPEFADVTIPYWNYFNDHDKQMATKLHCDSFATCSTFLQDLGGSGGNQQTFSPSTGAEAVTGRCAQEGLGHSSCANPDGIHGVMCEHCLLRGDWDRPNKYMGIVRQMVLDSLQDVQRASTTTNPHAALNALMEKRFHNTVHSQLGGALKTRGSPFDPVFYGHHGMVDLLQYIHNRCYYKGDNASSTHAFDIFRTCQVTLSNTTTVSIFPTDDIVMRYRNLPPEQDPMLAPYFKGLGHQFNWYINAEQLGEFSYSYVLDDYLKTLLTQAGIVCPNDLLAATRQQGDGSEATVVNELTATIMDCGRELVANNPDLSLPDVHDQLSILECEAIRQRQGVNFEDYDAKLRAEFRISDQDFPFCFGLLRDVANKDMEVLTSDACREKYGGLTNTDLVDGFGKTLHGSADL